MSSVNFVLYRWRIMENYQCDICKGTETTFHVLLKMKNVTRLEFFGKLLKSYIIITFRKK